VTRTVRTWTFHARVHDDVAQDIQVTARSARTHFVATLKPDDALKLIEELTEALDELDIEVVRVDGGPKRKRKPE